MDLLGEDRVPPGCVGPEAVIHAARWRISASVIRRYAGGSRCWLKLSEIALCAALLASRCGGLRFANPPYDLPTTHS